MAEIFISAKEAKRRYFVADLRTLQSRAKRGEILYQVIDPDGRRPQWLFESPEARYERITGNSINV